MNNTPHPTAPKLTHSALGELALLLGGKIVKLARSGVDEEGNEFFGLVVKTDKGLFKTLWLFSDFEGNAPGGFAIEDFEKP